MKAIITRANADGSFDEVGMNNRTVAAVRSRAAAHTMALVVGGPVRVQLWHSERMFYGAPPNETWEIGA